MTDKLVEKMVRILNKTYHGNPKTIKGLAERLLQAILSDPSIVEIVPGAELPEMIEGKAGGRHWQAGFSFAMSLVKQAGWVKRKDGD